MSTACRIDDEDREARTTELLHQALHCEDDDTVRDLHHRAVVLNRDLALTLSRHFRGRGIEVDDLEQVAYVGLCKAVAGYREPCVGFTPYAVPTIRGELRRHFRDHGWLVRPPRSAQEADLAVRTATPHLTQTLGREPNDTDLAAHLGLTREEVTRSRIADRAFHGVAIDAPLGGSTLTLGDLLGSDDDDLSSVEWRLDLRRALTTLSDRHLLALRLRFEKDWSQREIGEVLGVSQMQVSRILTKALGLLRAQLEDPTDAPRPVPAARELVDLPALPAA
ncbi:sigma-70 family RNA polymerase sigma factor [Lapillicoccus jejuensis]|uniref:RNA polymerase sigma-37 (RpsB/SigB) subunit n=1 Tax=Lapillicoccus jejuensis TaxID=402171 RepID=A0A542DY02_9MICO|nr:sigma-70 family RNA polymerase sigma factor [Lapillicoccus jejuensis]TQJ07814.1 RNA polymerase sigma-37 (RpsB/SigB) subunit [Lapillicoccus jejuensis]